MDLEILHSSCKDATRNAFNEYKRQIEVDLFPFDSDLHENFKLQMFQDITTPVLKRFINTHNLSNQQLMILNDTIHKYKVIAGKTANNYAKRLL